MRPQEISKKIFYLGHKENLSMVNDGKLGCPTEIEYFWHGQTSSAAWLLRFRIESSVMDG